MASPLRYTAGWYGGAVAATTLAYWVALWILMSSLRLGGLSGLGILLFGGIATYGAYVALLVLTVRISPGVSLLHRAAGVALCIGLVPILMLATLVLAWPD
ncbi:hypothetical protein [Phenylobacterium deserti]|uniref:Uncharacterized protein n=1 Tax=Phenylobacterium deserti TaxID=1914756 RepID=A0A328AVP6_9CAUL|nr:hypothetical protein [Phenylobacterium deserti]RAK56998.1 hypothetical protein DJ018_03255 [Phenylobacterium deserti]